MTSKYDPLGDHLAAIGTDEIAMTFAEVEAIIGPLPRMARRSWSWWGSATERYPRTPHVWYWRQCGYVADRPDYAAETVTFRRIAR